MPLPCPDCSAPLPDVVGEACPACDLPLRGAPAARLYEIDTALAALGAERAQVLAVLRAARTRVLVGAGAPLPAAAMPPAPPPAPSRSPQRVLLGLGALLILVATSVFLAVVWLLIGVVGQVAVMAGATAGAGAASVETARRGLASTATTLAWLAAGLTVVAVQAGRALGLPGLADLSAEGSVALGAGVGAVLAALTARRTGQAVFAVQAVGASALVGPCLLLAVGAEPAVLVAVTAAWALLALAVARSAPGLLHPDTAAQVRTASEALGLVALLLSVAGGLLVAGLDDPAPALRTAVVVTALVAAVQQACTRLAPQALPAAALATGAAGALLVWRCAEAAVASPAGVVTSVGVLAWVAAAGLLAVRGTAARSWAGAAAAGASLLLGHALLRQDWAAVAALAAGLALAAAVAGALHRAHDDVRAVALPVAAAAALGALAAGLVAAGASALTVVVAAAVGAAVVTGWAAWSQEQPEEPGLAAVALVGLATALTGALEVPAPALTAAGLLAAGGVVALGYACLPRRGLVAPLGVALSAAASWTLLAERGVDLLEVYTLPVAALLLVVGLVRRSRDPEAASWTTVGPAVAMALLPSAQLAATQPTSVRLLVVLAAGCAVVLAGVRLHLRALVVSGGVVVAELGVVQLGEAALYLPRWLVLAVLGGLLLGAGATYEARVEQARAAGRWISALR